MARKNPHIGSSFESWLEDTGIHEEVTAAAIKAVIARQLASEMKKKKITKQCMAELTKTSRAHLDRLLVPAYCRATIESLQRAAKIVGRSCGCNWCSTISRNAVKLTQAALPPLLALPRTPGGVKLEVVLIFLELPPQMPFS